MMGLHRTMWLTVTLIAGGCAGTWGAPPRPVMNPGLCHRAAQALQAAGGLPQWQKVALVRTKAVIAIHQGDGAAYVNEVNLTVDLAGGTLEADGKTATGAWHGRADMSGKSDLSGTGLPAEAALRDRLGEALAILLHRLRGPMNLLLGSDKPADVSHDALVDGRELVRLGARGQAFGTRAYYFDKTDRMLQLVTAGGDAPAAKGTVTLYEYQKAGRLLFPQRLRVVRIGANVLVGREAADALLDVTFSGVKFQTVP